MNCIPADVVLAGWGQLVILINDHPINADSPVPDLPR